MAHRRGGIALILGSGGARGLAHIGVLRCLEDYNVRVQFAAGTSIGAFIGGLFASGIDAQSMEEAVLSMDKLAVARILMPGFTASGIISNARVRRYIQGFVGDERIEHLPIPFRAVSTDLLTGEELVFERGPLVDAILASIAIPGLFQPVYHNAHYLVDGGLCNPLPISIARKSGVPYCIAVDVSPNPERLRRRIQKKVSRKENQNSIVLPVLLSMLQKASKGDRSARFSSLPSLLKKKHNEVYLPTAVRVAVQSISISGHNLIALHLRDSPPDVLISPLVEEFDMLDFHKGEEIIRRGYDAAREALPAIQSLLKQ